MITIKRIHVKNFRSIVDETIELKDFNCFSGKNDSGKSNILKALNLFFNNQTDFNTPLDFNSDYSKFAKRGQKQAKEISIVLEILVPETFIEHGIKIWKKTWRIDGLHSDNMNELFKPASRGITWLQRMQYQYVPAVKSDDFFKNLLAKLYESMTDTANSALRDLNDEYSERLETLTLGLTNQLRQVLGMRSAIQMPSNLSTLFRDINRLVGLIFIPLFKKRRLIYYTLLQKTTHSQMETSVLLLQYSCISLSRTISCLMKQEIK